MSDYFKYIVVNNGGPSRDCECSILFSNIIGHAEMVHNLFPQSCVVGAGFCQIIPHKSGKLSIACFGESTTLKIKSRGEEDSKIVARDMFFDLYDRKEYVQE